MQEHCGLIGFCRAEVYNGYAFGRVHILSTGARSGQWPLVSLAAGWCKQHCLTQDKVNLAPATVTTKKEASNCSLSAC